MVSSAHHFDEFPIFALAVFRVIFTLTKKINPDAGSFGLRRVPQYIIAEKIYRIIIIMWPN